MAQITVATQSSSTGANDARPNAVQADNGNLWVVQPDRAASRINFYYSTNKGASWTKDSSWAGTSFPSNACMYMLGDKVWFWFDDVYGPFNNYIYFLEGTVNAARTHITVGTGTTLWSVGSADYAFAQGMVVHAEGTGFRAHLLSTNYYYGDNHYWRLNLDSSGHYVSTEASTNWSTSGIGGVNGSGRVVLDPATKDVFLLTVTNRGGGTYELWFQKREYASATWPAGTTRVLADVGPGIYNDTMDATFDGDRVVAVMYDNSAATNTPSVVERDKADTTTTIRTPPTGVSGSMGNLTRMALQTNAQKDVLITWNDVGTDVTDVYKNTFNRGAGTWDGPTLVRDTAPNTSFFGSSFIKDTKYFFFMGDDASNRPLYMLDDMLEVAYSGAATLTGVATAGATAVFTLTGGAQIPRPIVEIAFSTNPTSDVPVWTDVTEFVQSFSTRRGRQQELDVIEPGTASLVLDNDDRRFDPMNTASPYYPNILPVRRLRIRAVWNNVLYDVFSGYINGWPQEYPNHHRNVVQLDALDGLGFLSFADLTLSRPEELSGSRVESVLNAANWSAMDRDLAAGVETFRAESELSGTALSIVQDCARMEHGRLFASRSGKITFQGRDVAVYNPPASSGTWSDDDAGPDFAYDDVVPSMDEEKIWNRVTTTGPSGTPQVAEDLTSQAQFFIRDLSHDGSMLTDDVTAATHSQFLLVVYKDPALRFTSMDVDPRADGAYAAALGLELGDHIVAEKFSTSAISQDVFVDGINTDVSRDDKSWSFTLYLTPLFTDTTNDWWVVGEVMGGTAIVGDDPLELAF